MAMANQMYVYSRVGQADRVEVLRYLAVFESEPLPGTDVPTTPAVGTVVAHDVAKDDAGNSVILALDPTPTRQEANTAKQEGWEVVPENDPLRSAVPGVAPEGE
jgi:hypothetical protein